MCAHHLERALPGLYPEEEVGQVRAEPRREGGPSIPRGLPCSHLWAECNEESDGVILHAVGSAPHSHPPRHNGPSALEHRDLGQEQRWVEAACCPTWPCSILCCCPSVRTWVLDPKAHTVSRLEAYRQPELGGGSGILTLLRVTGRYRVWGP